MHPIPSAYQRKFLDQSPPYWKNLQGLVDVQPFEIRAMRLSEAYLLCKLSAVLPFQARLKNQDGKVELQIIVSFNKPEERWQIETAFIEMKTSGFNIEDTHLADIDRIERLFALMTIAFTWAYLVGIYKDANIKPIRILKHGRRAKSLFKYGLEKIEEVISNPFKKEKKFSLSLKFCYVLKLSILNPNFIITFKVSCEVFLSYSFSISGSSS